MGKLVKQLGLDAMGSTFTGPPSHINSHSDFRPLFNEVFVFFFFSKLLQDCLRALTNQTVHELFLLLLLLLSHFCRVRLCVTP